MSSSSNVTDAESVAADRLMSLAALFERKSEAAVKAESATSAGLAETPASSSLLVEQREKQTSKKAHTSSEDKNQYNDVRASTSSEGRTLTNGTTHKPNSSQEPPGTDRNPNWIHTAMHNYKTVVTDVNENANNNHELRGGDISDKLRAGTSFTSNTKGSPPNGFLVHPMEHVCSSSIVPSNRNGSTASAKNALGCMGSSRGQLTVEGSLRRNSATATHAPTHIPFESTSGVKPIGMVTSSSTAKKIAVTENDFLGTGGRKTHQERRASFEPRPSVERRGSTAGHPNQHDRRNSLAHPSHHDRRGSTASVASSACGDEDEGPTGKGGDSERRPSLPRTYFVTHDYVDHANVRCDDVKDFDVPKRSNRGGVKSLFPEKLHQLLSMGPEHVDPSVISWAPHGRCFSVHNVREFTRELMPRYFNHTAITSFQRQLNLYGFKRITKTGSRDQGAYYHELFLRGRPMLCRRMRRQKIKGTGYKPLPDPDNEPDFYSMEPCYEDDLDDSQKIPPEEHHDPLSGLGHVTKGTLASLSSGPVAGGTRKASPLVEENVKSNSSKGEPPNKKSKTTAAGRSPGLSGFLPPAMTSGTEIVSSSSPRAQGIDAASQALRTASAAAAAAGTATQEGSHLMYRQGALAGIVPSSPTASALRTAAATGQASTLQGSAAGACSALQQQRQALAASGVPSSSEAVLQQLLSRAYAGGEGAAGSTTAPAAAAALVQAGDRSALQDEIEMLEATRRNVMLQQQRLEMLLSGAGAGAGGAGAATPGGRVGASGSQQQLHSHHLTQLAAAYDNAQGSAASAATGLPQSAAGTNAAFLARQLAGLERGTAGAAPGASAAGGPPVAAAGSAAALYGALEDLVASGRITSEQLDGIEAILASGRGGAGGGGAPASTPSATVSAALQQPPAGSGLSRLGRNGWI